MKLLWIGGGSLGLLFAGKTARTALATVTLVARTAEQAERIQANGVRVSESGRVETIPLHCLPYSEWKEEEQTGEPPDWICLMVKQTDIDEPLIGVLKRKLMRHGRTKLLCFQNGAGHLERLMEAGIPAERLYAAVTHVGARREDSHHVAFTGKGQTKIGAAAGGSSTELQKLLHLFQAAGFECAASERIQAAIYEKLLVNSIINPLTAVLHVRNGELLQSNHAMELMRRLYDEACEVLQEEGLPISETLWARVLEVCKQTAANTSSMLQDLHKGRPTEIDFINGRIVSLAAARNQRVPVHETMVHLVKSLEVQAPKTNINGAGEARSV